MTLGQLDAHVQSSVLASHKVIFYLSLSLFPSAFDLLASFQLSYFLLYLAVSKTSVHTLTFNPQSLLTVLFLSFSFAYERFFYIGLNSLKVPFCRSRAIEYAQGFKPSTPCGHQMLG